MNPNEFKNILKIFSDPESKILVDSSSLLVQVNDNIIQCDIEINNNSVFVLESGKSTPALAWILRELARIDIFANRILNVLKNDEFYVYPELKCEEIEEKIDLDSYQQFTTFIREKSILNTGVVYLTSDAGEGKTSFVNELAIYQAKLFSEKKADYLIVPISLGGRTFHRFDDIVMGSLANKYRFPFMNYEAFMEMIKLRVIIPALDGFEEMFVESGSGEALSAMGILLNNLNSCGSIIVSARKAYYEFENLKIQTKLFDVIRDLDVQFYKIDIERWDSQRFITYLENCKVSNPNDIYARIIEVLHKDHAIITRPVLAKKFVELIRVNNNLEIILPELKESGNRFFNSLVDSIIQREANEKWLEKSGTDSIIQPLISIENHYDLLSLLALEMWLQKKDYLNEDIIGFVVELYAETNKMKSETVRQIRNRLKGHALLVISKNDSKCIEFDHEEFKEFFLSRQIAILIKKCNASNPAKNDLINIFRKSLLNENIKNLLPSFFQNGDILFDTIKCLESISVLDGVNSYAHQNCADIITKILSKLKASSEKIQLNGFNFGINALSATKFTDIDFTQCNFAPSNIEASEFSNCTFKTCEFETFPIGKLTKFENTKFSNCTFGCIEYQGKKHFDKHKIESILTELGLSIRTEKDENSFIEEQENDEEIIQLEKILKYILRSTHISESIIRMKIGNHASSYFIDEVLPILEKNGVMVEVENRGKTQKRYKLGHDLSFIENCIEKSKGSFSEFIEFIKK
jgi:uncharacterized protein YjbI with pentapeptide repeats